MGGRHIFISVIISVVCPPFLLVFTAAVVVFLFQVNATVQKSREKEHEHARANARAS
jgi:uncharacterized membrane protein